MRQAVLDGPRRFRIEEAPAPALAPHDVMVAVRACGVCASELHTWRTGAGAPLVLGHEVAGEVAAVGAAVTAFAPGDRVTGLFGRGFAEQAVAPADRVAAVPPGMRLEHAFGEPLACAVSAARRTRVELGDRVAVVGLGFMGLLMLQLLRWKGAAAIVGVDPRADARDAALRLGADSVVAGGEAAPGVEPPFDVVVEATGTQAGLTLAGAWTREHGFLSILGYHQGEPRQVDMQLWNYRALDVLNAHERRADVRMDCMRRGLGLAAAGRIDLAALTTHTYGLDRIGDAFAALDEKPPGFLKSVVVLGPAG